jgi:dGTPase
VPGAILDYDAQHPLGLSTHAGAEAQAAAIADDIAYDAHDIDDGLRAGLFTIDDLRSVPFLAELLEEIDGRYPGLELSRRIHELTRRVITRFVEDAIRDSGRRIAEVAPASVEDVRAASFPVVCFSPAFVEADRAIKDFLYPRMYRHPDVTAVRAKADTILRDLFARFMAEPAAMPDEWHEGVSRADEPRLARRVADYIAGMTDRYAVLEHKRLFATTPDLR